MTLSDTSIRSAKRTGKPYTLADSDGLFLAVSKEGVKAWHFRYMWCGKQKRMSFGLYPEVSLKQARELLASDQVISPVIPEMMAARELQCGTVPIFSDLITYRALGIAIPPLKVVINRLHPVSTDARMIVTALREAIEKIEGVEALDTCIPAIEAFQRASTLGVPVHRYENANCIGCVKGGEGYWRAIREDFPQAFERIAQVQDEIGPGAYFFRNRKTGERYGLRGMPAGKPRRNESPPACSFFCELAEQAYAG